MNDATALTSLWSELLPIAYVIAISSILSIHFRDQRCMRFKVMRHLNIGIEFKTAYNGTLYMCVKRTTSTFVSINFDLAAIYVTHQCRVLAVRRHIVWQRSGSRSNWISYTSTIVRVKAAVLQMLKDWSSYVQWRNLLLMPLIQFTKSLVKQ